MNNHISKKLELIILLVFLFVTATISILSVYDMPLFSDSTFHATTTRSILRTGFFPSHSPVGWTLPLINSLSYEQYLTHPPLFYMLTASLASFGVSLIDALSFASIIPSILLVYYFYKFNKNYFGTNIAIMATLLIIFMPMNIWLISHRLMEPFQYLLAFASFYYAQTYIKSNLFSAITLSSIFAGALLYIKITSLFILVGLLLFLILSKVKLKIVLFFLIVVGLIYLPYVQFSLSTRGTISYAPPGLPIVDKYIFNPWWNWSQNEYDKELDIDSNQKSLSEKLDIYEKKKKSLLLDDIIRLNFVNALQKYTIFPLSNKANIHWFSPTLIFGGLYLLILLMGIIIYLRKYTSTKFHFILIPLVISISSYLSKVGELRYFFTLNILTTILYALSITEILQILKHRYAQFVLISVIIVSLSLIASTELDHSYLYKHSLSHNIMPNGSGIEELNKVDKSMLLDGKNIFTSSLAEVSYYLDRKTVWDYRIIFVPEDKIDKYLDAYNVFLVILPNFVLTTNYYNISQQSELPNTVENWEGGAAIPLDSPFYKYLNDEKYVEKKVQFKAFTVYKRLNTSNKI